ncbi:Gst Glutathione S-transferase [Burkholderiaceae bacterium]|jgi:glutathione S-transferase
MTARFYYSPRSCALASHIVLEHVGADFEAIRLDFQANQQRSAEYLAINAKGRVPALVTERGVITETPAILLYLAQTHPQSGVAPLDDPFALAELQAVNSWFCSTVHVAHAHGTRGARWADDASALQAMKAKVAQNMTDCFDWIERELLRGPWVMGKDFSVADPYLFTLTIWLMQNGVELARFPRVADHYQRMLALPAVQKIAPLHNL